MRLLLSAVLFGCFAAPSFAAEPDAEGTKLFESQVRPLLSQRCFSCHGEKKQKGGLRLDSLEAASEGGESGAAIVPGKPDESLMIDAINYSSLEMPPEGKLTESEIKTLTEWIKRGAPWPKEKPAVPKKELGIRNGKPRGHRGI